jgi:hypothetical protein
MELITGQYIISFKGTSMPCGHKFRQFTSPDPMGL